MGMKYAVVLIGSLLAAAPEAVAPQAVALDYLHIDGTAFQPVMPSAGRDYSANGCVFSTGAGGLYQLNYTLPLPSGVTIQQLEAELNTIIGRLADQYPETEAQGHRVVITPLADYVFGDARPALWLLLAATGLLLSMPYLFRTASIVSCGSSLFLSLNGSMEGAMRNCGIGNSWAKSGIEKIALSYCST